MKNFLSKLKQKLRSLKKRRKGSTALEFAIISGPFFLLLFGIIELTIIFIMDSAVNQAAWQAARFVRTGQIQNAASPSVADLRSQVCGTVTIFGSCQQLNFFVGSYDSFVDSLAASQTPGFHYPNFHSTMTFDPGNPGEIVIVRTFYLWNIRTPFISRLISGATPSGDYIIASSYTYRNEPF